MLQRILSPCTMVELQVINLRLLITYIKQHVDVVARSQGMQVHAQIQGCAQCQISCCVQKIRVVNLSFCLTQADIMCVYIHTFIHTHTHIQPAMQTFINCSTVAYCRYSQFQFNNASQWETIILAQFIPFNFYTRACARTHIWE